MFLDYFGKEFIVGVVSVWGVGVGVEEGGGGTVFLDSKFIVFFFRRRILR